MCPGCGSRSLGLQAPRLNHVTQNVTLSAATVVSGKTVMQNPVPNKVNITSGLILLPAPLGPRLFASFIDTIIVSLLASLPILFAHLMTLPSKQEAVNPSAVLGVMASFAAPYVYYTLMHASPNGATFGKRWMGIKVVNISGEMLTKMQAFLRIMVTLLLPLAGLLAVVLSLGSMAITYKDAMQDSIIYAIIVAFPIVFVGPYLCIFFNPLKQSLFDILMKTIVIRG